MSYTAKNIDEALLLRVAYHKELMEHWTRWLQMGGIVLGVILVLALLT